jgi:ArsR family transcriptional regulator, arsenate/arsenite/antimonite-responsive transcriptional repressor
LSILTGIDILSSTMKRTDDPDVRLLQAIADPTRLAIVRQLASDGAVCACDFTSCCEVAQPTVSHHLKVLRDAGWVTTERRGTWIYYSLAPEAAARLRSISAAIVPGPAIPSGLLTAGRGPRRLPTIQPRA